MRSRSLILVVLLYSSLYYNCLSDKTCSDDDKSCSPQAFFSSLFIIPSGVYIYSTNTKYQGNLAAYGSTFEESGQNICKQEKLFSSLVNQFCSEVRALISTSTVGYSNFSETFSVPDLPVYGPTGSLLNSNWSSFETGAGGLKLTFAEAGLGPDDFWSFTEAGGVISSNNCNAGIDNSVELFGVIGSASTKASDWMNLGGESTASCDSYHRVYCICYTTSSE
ncbi:hypothetical protein [Leptospira andrefontaineae]|uniref:DUF1554 domain-containing protein n=1 Tax=Leptospira andrefontaineae TaxID=2484976 RepID=A0A4V3JGT4_9LEPT|nr:hypothetical protein [Leptospira andrefontaineae]TGK44508.1 hypothetical protein EHO65_00270 [Leptospira andrefontaineae]